MKTLRLFENVIFPDYSQNQIEVKMDTGAHTGAIHAEDITIIERNGEYLLSFRPFGLDTVVTKDCFHALRVRSSNGEMEQRFSVLTQIIIDGKKYKIRLSLRDRSDMKTKAIIGSRFLKNKFIIDPR